MTNKEEELLDLKWDDLLRRDGYVGGFENGKEKILVLEMPPKMKYVEKFGKKQYELVCNCIEEDGEPREDTLFTSLSPRLIATLKPLVEVALAQNKPTLKVAILRVGDKFNTNYVTKVVE